MWATSFGLNNTVEWVTGKEQAQERSASENIQTRLTLTPASVLGAAMPQKRKNDVFENLPNPLTNRLEATSTAIFETKHLFLS